MDPTERFTELVRLPDSEVALDEAMLAIAAHDHDVDASAWCERLDELAAAAPGDAAGLARYLFVDQGFLGNDHDYSDPRNSFLDCVLERRLGIPISLSIVMMEVGRRRGIALAGIGMPGHFLVGGPRGELYDPFHAGQRLDAVGARALFASMRGAAPFHDEYLAPVGAHAILARVLANLLHAFAGRAPASAVWAARLRLRVPGSTTAERREIAALLGSLGHFAEAAAEMEALAEELDDADAALLARDAASLRARAN
jgi:regulator of sirC expression with transglutaminase-like and TPR domain